jgi:acyl-CoA synthetase (AMP-forming)/AMP-acid ligase II
MPNSMTGNWLYQRLVGHGDKPFLAIREQVFSYADLKGELEQISKLFGGTISPGQSVAIQGDYTLSSIATLLWLYFNRNIAVPVGLVNPHELEGRLIEGYCDYLIDCTQDHINSPPQKVGKWDDSHRLIEGLRSVGHSGLILFSSGSEGKPKAMIHDLNHLIDVYSNRKSRDIALLVFLMFDHIGGVNTLFTSLASGSFMVAPSTRDADEVASLIERYRVVLLPTSPTFLNLLLIADAHQRHDLSSLKIITYGTEPMPSSLLERLRVVFPKVKFLQTFGTSETGISRSESKSSGSLFMKLNDPDIEHKVVDGELWLRSKTQILGYLNYSMDRFTEDGWFKTGDKVEEDGDGYIRVLCRRGEVINVGGEKVIPAEVESVLLEIAGVIDCTVFGSESPITGQVVAARVAVTKDADTALLKREIRRFCGERLQRYKVPVKIEFVETSLFNERFKKKRS